MHWKNSSLIESQKSRSLILIIKTVVHWLKEAGYKPSSPKQILTLWTTALQIFLWFWFANPYLWLSKLKLCGGVSAIFNTIRFTSAHVECILGEGKGKILQKTKDSQKKIVKKKKSASLMGTVFIQTIERKTKLSI